MKRPVMRTSKHSARLSPTGGAFRVARTRQHLKVGLAAGLVCVWLVGLANSADAQRRRRRRRPQEAEPAPQVDPPADAEATPAPEDGDPPPVEAAPTPEPEPPPAAAEPSPPPAEPSEPEAEYPDLTPLRADFATLMDELVQARSRIAVLGRQLFRTKVRIRVENRAGDQILNGFSVRLDGAPVFNADGNLDDNAQQVFEGFAAPGPHDIGIELEQRARANDRYRYVQRDKFRVVVVQDQLTEITIRLDDDSDIAEDFEDDGEGEYDVRVRVRAATRELDSES